MLALVEITSITGVTGGGADVRGRRDQSSSEQERTANGRRRTAPSATQAWTGSPTIIIGYWRRQQSRWGASLWHLCAGYGRSGKAGIKENKSENGKELPSCCCCWWYCCSVIAFRHFASSLLSATRQHFKGKIHFSVVAMLVENLSHLP